MKLAELPPQTIEQIKRYRYDRIIGKHEGPEEWESVLRYYDPEFLQIEGDDVLLPIGKEQHANITVLRCIKSADGRSLTIFLKDSTYAHDPDFEVFQAG